ncbi:MAG: rhodanese-like domain-containing protein [Wenzhouxiangellaceae bacterium]|nr:rhodanese-like domain-containing protein [Wenzhouxiangellaceae bacterium]
MISGTPPASALELASGYQFKALSNAALWRERAWAFTRERALLGTVLVAGEGINFSLAGATVALDQWLDWLASGPGLDAPVLHRQRVERAPFQRLRVRLRDEIVTFDPDACPDRDGTATHLDPAAWNVLIARPDVQLVDARNDYEYRIGTFSGAQNPGTESFTEFKRYCDQMLDRDRPVAMFCTGGVRCEKAGAWMKRAGYAEVYQLEGGILRYLAQTEANESRWRGECFVFDDRVAVGPDLSATGRIVCRGCRRAVAGLDAAGNPPLGDDDDGCRACGKVLDADRAASLRERARQLRLAEARGEIHLGPGAQVKGTPA